MVSLLLALIYICFISLGLPDSLLGSAWPSMQIVLGVPVSFAGIISMLVCIFTIFSSLFSDKIVKKLGVGLVVFLSTILTSFAMLGFAFSTKFWMLILFTIPYGLGAGCIDATLNNYIALHYKSSHMSWLHCMWGLGCSISPYIMGFALAKQHSYSVGYITIGIIQFAIAVLVLLASPLWKKQKVSNDIDTSDYKQEITFKSVFNIKGVIAISVTFFCYCSLEQTAILWGSSYLNIKDLVPSELAASLGSLFFIGITSGRAINGFLTYKFSNTGLIRMGLAIILLGILVMFLPFNMISTSIALVLIGLGCAPIYPNMMHSIPIRFGANASQVIMGLQMASAYIGICVMPPLFGIIAQYISIALLPLYLLVLLIVMFVMHEIVIKKTKKV